LEECLDERGWKSRLRRREVKVGDAGVAVGHREENVLGEAGLGRCSRDVWKYWVRSTSAA
jgi:hypothetical protein